MDNCPDLLDKIANTNQSVKTYLREECHRLLKNNGLTEGIENALPYGSDSDRTELIEKLIRDLAEIL